MHGDSDAALNIRTCPECGAEKSDGSSAAPAAMDWDGNEYSHALPIQLLGSIDAMLGRRADGSGHAVLASTGMPISTGTDAQDAWNSAQDVAGHLGRRRLQGAIDQGVPVNVGTNEFGSAANAIPQDQYDEMGQPLHGRSHFNRWNKMSEIWNSGLPIGDKLLNEWQAASYTVPDAQPRIDQMFGQHTSNAKPAYGLEFALGFPFTAPLGVGMAVGADDRKLQLLDQASAGLMGAGGVVGEALTAPSLRSSPMNAPYNRGGLMEPQYIEGRAQVSLKPSSPVVDALDLEKKGAWLPPNTELGSPPLAKNVVRGLQERFPAPSGMSGQEALEDAEEESGGPESPRNPLSENISYPDPAPRIYDGGFSPDTQVTDHIHARALGGSSTDSLNLLRRPWQENAIKGGHERNYLREKARYIQDGLTPEEANWVLEDYFRWIQNDIHAMPVDPENLKALPSP